MVPHKVIAHCGLENRAKEVLSRLYITNYVSVRSCRNLSIEHCIGRVISDIVCIYIQGVPGGKDLTSGECSLSQTIPI
jgi:hypothetical protein